MNSKKLFSIFFALLLSAIINGQVGINTPDPQATLDIVGDPSNTLKLDGVIAPRLRGAELAAKTYTAAQTGAIVYVTLAAGTLTGQVINVSAPGYYYFDGSVWKSIGSGSGGSTTLNTGTGLNVSGSGATATPYNVDMKPAIKFMYMPSISINTSATGTGFTRNLYGEYTAQFGTPSAQNPGSAGAPIPVFAATDLNYYVTYFDPAVFANVSITDAGTLNYDVIGSATSCSFINVVFVLK
ncbi:hypothetical protein [Chryseobacterium limigenitum]